LPRSALPGRKRAGPDGPDQRLDQRQYHRRPRQSDAALSTLAYERQARVTAQLPTGRVYSMSRKSSKNAATLNIVLNNYIIPNADDQFDMLIKLRLWGVYASVYGSMPMMYDYRVDDAYIGPTCYLVDPRCIAPVDGLHNVQQAGCYISTIITVTELEAILPAKRPATTSQKLINLSNSSRTISSAHPKTTTKTRPTPPSASATTYQTPTIAARSSPSTRTRSG
jgi:hypothetical protein